MGNGVYTIEELERLSGVRLRTLRHWAHEKLLPRPLGYGRAARYTDAHLLRAKVVRGLREQRVPLRTVRFRLSGKSDDELRALLPPEPPPTAPDGVPLPPPPPIYPATQWELVTLMDGLLLLVNAERGPLPRRIAAEIHRHYAMGAR